MKNPQAVRKESLFISYSRREAPFADSLIDVLEDRGFNVWLDYHSLIPGRPWLEQIMGGIRGANVVLLILSKESMKSPNCKDEWQEAIRLKKRIILLIFEAVQLPPELETYGYEWIDFRSSFKKRVKQLINQIGSPAKATQPPPRKGFKAPLVVWISFVVSLFVAFISLPLVLTVYVPYYLLPLPYKILKRDFNFFYVQTVLIIMPFMFLLAEIFLTLSSEQGIYLSLMGTAIVFAALLLILLRSSGMRRWGKPIASPARFANPYNPEKSLPEKIIFAVDYAPEDKKYADAVIQDLQEHGHIYDETGGRSEVGLVLISAFKNSTAFNPEEKIVYPVIIQTAKGVDRTLQRNQWIDFRRGISKLNVVAGLLPEPSRMLKAIGVAPTSNQQTVVPSVIQSMIYYFTAMGIFSLGGWLVFFLNNPNDITAGIFFTIAVFLGLLLWTTFSATRSLVNRKGWVASVRNLVIVIVVMGVLQTVLFFTGAAGVSEQGIENLAGNSALFGTAIYLLGLILIIPLAIKYREDLLRWFPQKVKT